MWGSWIPQEVGLRRSTGHSRHRLYLKSFTSSEQKCLMQTCEEVSSSQLEECRHVQISFVELGKDDSGLSCGAYFFPSAFKNLFMEWICFLVQLKKF